jgi:dCMP deaminase
MILYEISHRGKYHDLYWQIAEDSALMSPANKRKVGCVIVAKSGVVSIGWNAMPTGFHNSCEWECEDAKGDETGKTKPEVIHAERNAIYKMIRAKVDLEGSIIFTTTAPCIFCAELIAAVGITSVYYLKTQSNVRGLDYLTKHKINHFCHADKDGVRLPASHRWTVV